MLPRKYENQSPVTFLPPVMKLFFVAIICFLVFFLFQLYLLLFLPENQEGILDFSSMHRSLDNFSGMFVVIGTICAGAALWFGHFETDQEHIAHMLKYRLFSKACGNPLGLKHDSFIPALKVKNIGNDQYRVTIDTSSCSADTLVKMPKIISAGLVDRYAGWGVVAVDEDPASSFVSFIIEDINRSRKIFAKSVDDLCTGDVTRLRIQEGFDLDLTRTGSILICGKTRSGKTTAIESILMQVLAYGPDNYGSKVVIIDPKNAELSRLPYVIAPDKDGDATAILQALQDYADTRIRRQEVLDELSEEYGRPVMWWDTGMHPCFLFLDEWVALQAIIPKKAPKDNPTYCLQTLQDLLRKLVTTGASAGCFVILSTAEASVESAGVPSMIRAAMSTKILMRPTKQEGELLWSTKKMEALPERLYAQGDAWASSEDGIHDNPSFVQFPKLDFPEYEALRTLLINYNI